MLTLISQDGQPVEIDTTKLYDNAPVILYNVTAEDELIDFNAATDAENARFTIYFADGSEQEFNWLDQSDDALEDISQLDNPM